MEVLKAERVGHGYRTLEDPALYKQLLDQKMHFEVRPLTNQQVPVVQKSSDQIWKTGCSKEETDSDTFSMCCSKPFSRIGITSIPEIRITLIPAGGRCQGGFQKQMLNRTYITYNVILCVK